MKSVVRAWMSVCFMLLAVASYGQSSGDSNRFGIGVKGSFLGGGAEAAARVTHHINVRGGFNMFDYSRTFNKDGVAYGGQLDFKTVEGHLDYFPFAGSFHVSGGVLDYVGNPITANATLSATNSFTLGGVTYYSSPSVPATGNGKINFNQASPTATIGWGNLVPRKAGKHFSVPVKLGVAFQGSPKAALNINGQLCTGPSGTGTCANAATDPTILSNIVAEQTKINNSMKFFKMYPIISVGFGYAF